MVLPHFCFAGLGIVNILCSFYVLSLVLASWNALWLADIYIIYLLLLSREHKAGVLRKKRKITQII